MSPILLVIMFGPLLSMLDAGIVNVGLPSMAAEFGATTGEVQWVSSVYLLSISALLPLLGSLADQIGRKRMYSTGFLVLSLFSLASWLAPNLLVLILTRILQGVGGAMIIANGMALATEHSPAQRRGQNLGILSTVGALGSIVSPALGGFLIDAVGWRSVFLISFVVAGLGWVAASRVIPRDSRPVAGIRLDGVGAALLGAAVAFFGLGLSEWWPLEGVAATLLVAFLWWERRAQAPLLRVELFRNPQFVRSWSLALAAFAALFSPTVLVPFYFQNALGWTAAAAGAALMAFPVALAVTSPFAGRLADRWGTHRLTLSGLTVGVLGLSVLAVLGSQAGPVMVVACLAVLGVALGLFQAPNNSALMGAAPRELLGSATAFTQLARNLGTGAGIAMTGTAFAVLQRLWGVPPSYFPAATVLYGIAAGVLLLAGVASLRGLREGERRKR